jgi:hypothetical protein
MKGNPAIESTLVPIYPAKRIAFIAHLPDSAAPCRHAPLVKFCSHVAEEDAGFSPGRGTFAREHGPDLGRAHEHLRGKISSRLVQQLHQYAVPIGRNLGPR